MIFDTHAHLNFSAFKDDRKETAERSLNGGVYIINVGAAYDTSREAVRIAEEFETGVYASVGLHPIHSEEENFDIEKYRELADSKKVVAIGETGLDLKKEYACFIEKQREVFLKQIDLSEELELPLVFHCRMAHKEMINILYNKRVNGVVHCFTGKKSDACKYLDMGFYLGFNGIIFKLNLDRVIKETPLDRILIETDCPYLTPPQEEGRNEPLYVKYVAEKIAEIKGVKVEEVEKASTENAKKLFKI